MYAHFLHTGAIFHYCGFTIIGDTGFTNFEYHVDGIRYAKTGRLVKQKHIAKKEHFMKEDNGIPDISQIKSWDINDIRKKHKDWIDFANLVIETNDHTIVVTHFPMSFDPPKPFNPPKSKKAFSTWWTSNANLKITDENWYIFGHTYKPWEYHNGTVLARQSGYKRKSTFYEIHDDWFGKLHFYSGGSELSSPSHALAKFQDFNIVRDPKKEVSLVNQIRKIGYKRIGIAENKKVISAYMNNPSRFIQDVRKKIKKKSKMVNGYVDDKAYSINQNRKAVTASLKILENGYDQNNPFEFITALIVSGYAYSNMISFLDSMRPVNGYDVARYAMFFVTLQYYSEEIDLNEIESVRRSNENNSYITIANVNLWLPKVNDYELPIENILPFQDEFNLYLMENDSEKPLELKDSSPNLITSEQRGENYIEQEQRARYIRERAEQEPMEAAEKRVAFLENKTQKRLKRDKLKPVMIENAKKIDSSSSRHEIVHAMYGLNEVGASGYLHLFNRHVYSAEYNRYIAQPVDFEDFERKMEKYEIAGILENVKLYIDYEDGVINSSEYFSEKEKYSRTKEQVAIERKEKEELEKNIEEFYCVYPAFEKVGIVYNITRQEVNALLFKYNTEYDSFIRFQAAKKSLSLD